MSVDFIRNFPSQNRGGGEEGEEGGALRSVPHSVSVPPATLDLERLSFQKAAEPHDHHLHSHNQPHSHNHFHSDNQPHSHNHHHSDNHAHSHNHHHSHNQHHSRSCGGVTIGGRPRGVGLAPAAGSLGGAEECFRLITTGARSADEVREAENADELVVQAMAFIAQQTERIRMEAAAEDSVADPIQLPDEPLG